jgi:hypothetical protein
MVKAALVDNSGMKLAARDHLWNNKQGFMQCTRVNYRSRLLLCLCMGVELAISVCVAELRRCRVTYSPCVLPLPMKESSYRAGGLL